MKNPKEALKILRVAWDAPDDQINIAQTALALACLEKGGADMLSYQAHLDLLTAKMRQERHADRIDDQLHVLRQLIVVQHEYKSDDKHTDDSRANNIMDVIDRKSGGPIMLGVLYLHAAQAAGWAMTGVDLSGHFLLRLSARDGQVLIDPFRAGQQCLLQEVEEDYIEDDEVLNEIGVFDEENSVNLMETMARAISHRDVLLRLQHNVKRRLLAQDRVEPAISILQSMLLFAPQHEDLWREIGYLQAERGHLRAAITALEVVCDMASEQIQPVQTDGILRDLRMRLN